MGWTENQTLEIFEYCNQEDAINILFEGVGPEHKQQETNFFDVRNA